LLKAFEEIREISLLIDFSEILKEFLLARLICKIVKMAE